MQQSDREKAAQQAGNDIRSRVVELLENTPKTTLNKTIERLGDLAEAKETKFFQKGGKVTDSRDVEDNTTRLNANKFLAELHDAKPSEKHEHSGKVTLEEIIKAQDAENEK